MLCYCEHEMNMATDAEREFTYNGGNIIDGGEDAKDVTG